MILLAAACACLAIVSWPLGEARGIPPRGAGGSIRRRRLRRRREQVSDREALTAMLEGIGPALAAGVNPATAVSTSASLAAARLSHVGLREDLGRLARESAAGAELAPLWAHMYGRHRVPALDDIARAWALSEHLGCPIGAALGAATAMMREQVDLERRIAAVTAGPRATMQLLTALPILGVGIASFLGVPPWQLYAGRLGLTVLVLGALFLTAGRLLTRRMIRRAAAPAVLS